MDRHSAVIRKQLDWVAEAAHRIFADAFEVEIAFDEVGERAGQQHRSPQLFGWQNLASSKPTITYAHKKRSAIPSG